MGLNISVIYFLRKNIEKWVFFMLLAAAAILICAMIFTLPYFQTSLFGQKIHKKSDPVTIDEQEIRFFQELYAEIKQPIDFSKQYSRDPFSPDIERMECPSCGEMVSTKLDECPFCSFKFDTDQDGIPNMWEKKYGLNPHDPNDAYLDKDGDTFSNLAEYQEGTVPTDPMSKPEEENPIGKFKLIRIYRKTLDLLFDGYMLLPDGSYSFVINFGSSSHFKKIGETISGYTIVDFEKKLVRGDRAGVEVTNDESVLTLTTETGEKIKLTYHKLTTEKEFWTQILDTELQKTFKLRSGDSFGSFTIENITSTEVAIRDDEGNTYQLKYKRSSESW